MATNISATLPTFLTEDELAEVSQGCTHGSQGDTVIMPIVQRSELLSLKLDFSLYFKILSYFPAIASGDFRLKHHCHLTSSVKTRGANLLHSYILMIIHVFLPSTQIISGPKWCTGKY